MRLRSRALVAVAAAVALTASGLLATHAYAKAPAVQLAAATIPVYDHVVS